MLLLLWDRLTAAAAITAGVLGQAIAIAGWLVRSFSACIGCHQQWQHTLLQQIC